MFAHPWSADARFERIIEAGFLTGEDLEIFHSLTRHRRSLPLYLGGFWRCYECEFESSELTAMGTHILETHEPVHILPPEYVPPLLDSEVNTGVASPRREQW
jgi:hypothetical protein